MQQWKVWTALILSLGMVGAGLAYPAIAQERAQPKNFRTLTVTGRGSESIPTTLTQVRLGVEAQGKTANEVQQEVAQRSNSVVALLRSRNVTRLETTGITLNPNYRYDNNIQTLVGYNASNMVSFRVATPQAGDILDDAVKAGASRIESVSFVATDAAIADARKVALREATQDAQVQADAVLAALGLTRRDVVNIQVNNAFIPPPRPFNMATKFSREGAVADAAPSPVIGSDQEVEASVTLEISY